MSLEIDRQSQRRKILKQKALNVEHFVFKLLTLVCFERDFFDFQMYWTEMVLIAAQNED